MINAAQAAAFNSQLKRRKEDAGRLRRTQGQGDSIGSYGINLFFRHISSLAMMDR
jgi:hypothetical protein